MQEKYIKDIYDKKQHVEDDCKLWDQQEGGHLFLCTVYAACSNCRVVEDYIENDEQLNEHDCCGSRVGNKQYCTHCQEHCEYEQASL